MKKIGLIGGSAWVSTVEYYSEIRRAVDEDWLTSGDSRLWRRNDEGREIGWEKRATSGCRRCHEKCAG
jgi:hypothetical protein